MVYDRVNKWGGAERILLALHEIFPEAPLFTAVYDSLTAPWAKVFRVIPSFLNQFPLAKSHHEVYPWLMPLAFESFSAKGGPGSDGNFDEYDLVISVSSEASKGVITKPKTLHLCYCLTPTRYLWSGYEEYFKNSVLRLASRPVVNYLRQWDKIAAQRPDYYLAISRNVQKRIKKYYGRDSEVIYPPVETGEFRLGNQELGVGKDIYYLVVSRLVPYKKVAVAIEAFNRLNLPLKIVGVGSEMGRLKRMAKANIEFLGQLTDEQLLSYYQKCQAVVFPQEEDWGMVPLEAQSCGRPVIAFRGGGALETVVENKTGLFFTPQTGGALAAAVKKLAEVRLLKKDCRQNALKFKKEIFIRKFKNLIEQKWRNFRS